MIDIHVDITPAERTLKKTSASISEMCTLIIGIYERRSHFERIVEIFFCKEIIDALSGKKLVVNKLTYNRGFKNLFCNFGSVVRYQGKQSC